jgi:hypothetical protein
MRDKLRLALGLSDDSTSVKEIVHAAAGLPSLKRSRLASESARALLDEGSHDEKLRVLLAKVLVALLPDSLPQIRKLLRPGTTSASAEAQFSLFAFLDEIPQVLPAMKVRDTVLQLLSQYLVNVRNELAQSAWMAGDLLGDHWPYEEAVPVLIHAAKHGRFVAGREGALHGVSHALERAPKRLQWELVDALKSITEKDRSERVRQYAQAILGDLRGI